MGYHKQRYLIEHILYEDEFIVEEIEEEIDINNLNIGKKYKLNTKFTANAVNYKFLIINEHRLKIKGIYITFFLDKELSFIPEYKNIYPLEFKHYFQIYIPFTRKIKINDKMDLSANISIIDTDLQYKRSRIYKKNTIIEEMMNINFLLRITKKEELKIFTHK